MAYSINKVTLVGNIGNEPEVKTFQNGKTSKCAMGVNIEEQMAMT